MLPLAVTSPDAFKKLIKLTEGGRYEVAVARHFFNKIIRPSVATAVRSRKLHIRADKIKSILRCPFR